MLIISSMKVGALTQTASALASGDTEIHSANSMANRGSATSVTVGGDEPAGTGKNKAALIRFSLPTLPAGATITDTKLRLDVTESSTNTFRVFVMKKPWVEGEATWSMYKTAGVWDLAGGRGATDRESPAIARITPRATGVQDFYLGAAFDQQVGDWMSGEEDNDGIELIAAEAMDGFSFSTREVATASQRPQLIITYDDGIVADTTPPETTITSGPAEGETLTVDPATFGFSSSETGSTFECSLDGGAFGACTSPKSYAALSDGSHTLQVKATDAAGNTDLTPTSRTWTVDTTAPDTAIDSGPSGTLTVAGATFTFSSSESSPEAGAAFRCRLDGAAYSACTPPKSYTNLPNGSHTFDVRARDGAGNLDATPASMTFSVEVPPPPDPGTLRAERSLDHMYTKYQTDAELDFWLDKLAATGAETVQTAGAWDHFEPSADDSYSWAFMDKFIAHAEARGLKVRMQVSATPDWVHPYLASQGIAQSDRVWYPPRGSGEIALYQDFWHDLVARYGTRVASYEVWNEPNHDSFFEPKANVSEYAAMQRAAYLGAKSANPNVQIVCCALSGNDMGYLDQLYTALRAYPDASANDDFFDALGVHPYAYENSKPLAPAETRNNFLSTFGPADATFVGIDKMIADLDAHGDSHKKVWIGEFGYRMTSGGYHEPISDDLRAQYLKQAYALLDQRTRVMGMAWYSYYRDPSWALVNKSTRVESVSFDAFRQAAVRN